MDRGIFGKFATSTRFCFVFVRSCNYISNATLVDPSSLTLTESIIRIPLDKFILADREIGSKRLFRTRNQLKKKQKMFI